jgi:hypothetical protein
MAGGEKTSPMDIGLFEWGKGPGYRVGGTPARIAVAILDSITPKGATGSGEGAKAEVKEGGEPIGDKRFK